MNSWKLNIEGFLVNPRAKLLKKKHNNNNGWCGHSAVTLGGILGNWLGNKEVINRVKSLQINKLETSLYKNTERISLIDSKLRKHFLTHTYYFQGGKIYVLNTLSNNKNASLTLYRKCTHSLTHRQSQVSIAGGNSSKQTNSCLFSALSAN